MHILPGLTIWLALQSSWSQLLGVQVLSSSPSSPTFEESPWLSPEIRLLRAMDYMAAGEDPTALQWFTPLLQPEVSQHILQTAKPIAIRSALVAGAYEQAASWASELLPAMPLLADYLLHQQASALRGQLNWDAARQAWQTMIQHHPTSPLLADAWFGVGDSYYAQAAWSQASSAYQQALNLAPKSERSQLARFNLADMALRNQRTSEALGILQQLAKLDDAGWVSELAHQRLNMLQTPKNTTVRMSAAQVLLARIDRLLASRDLMEAESSLTELLAIKPLPVGMAEIVQRQATLAYRSQNYSQAITYIQQLIPSSKGHKRLELQRQLANAYAATGNFEQAVALQLEVAATYKNNKTGRDGLYRAAWLAYDGGLYEKAITLFTQLLQLSPYEPRRDDIRWYIGWSYFHQQQYEQAIAALEQLKKHTRSIQYIDRVDYWQGRMYALQGNPNAALQAYQLLNRRPNSYYGHLAAYRRRLLEQPAPLLSATEPASFHPIRLGEESARQIGTFRSEVLPWGDSRLAWQTPMGQRVLQLMQIGLWREAANELRLVPNLPQTNSNQSAYGKARLLYALGDYGNAYRLIATSHKNILEQAPTQQSKHIFYLAYPDAHQRLVTEAASTYGISPRLVLAVMRQESAFDDTARSWASARGLMQIIPITGRRIAEMLQFDPYHDATLREPIVNVRFGAWYLGQLLQKFQGHVVLAIGGYNAGPRAMQRWVLAHPHAETDVFVEDIGFKETRGYVKSVLANLWMYERLYGEGPTILPERIPSQIGENLNF